MLFGYFPEELLRVGDSYIFFFESKHVHQGLKNFRHFQDFAFAEN
jgi:hypothetical protein